MFPQVALLQDASSPEVVAVKSHWASSGLWDLAQDINILGDGGRGKWVKVGEMGEGGEKGQTSHYKINKS